MMKYDVTIIGAGIVGLATAYRLQEQDPKLKICVLEKEGEVAAHQTGHNSGVIHSGVYYKPGSLKALNCVKGYRQLTEFSERNDIPYEICGKVIVAVKKEQLHVLQTIFDRGQQNCLEDIRKISAEEIKEIEPHVTTAIEGVWVPQARDQPVIQRPVQVRTVERTVPPEQLLQTVARLAERDEGCMFRAP